MSKEHVIACESFKTASIADPMLPNGELNDRSASDVAANFEAERAFREVGMTIEKQVGDKSSKEASRRQAGNERDIESTLYRWHQLSHNISMSMCFT